MENRPFGETRKLESALASLVKLKNRLDSEGRVEPDKLKSFMEIWKLLAGDQLDEMLADAEKAKQNLKHPSWKMRLAAISVLRERWRQYNELALDVERMASEDGHPQVRECALFTLACCFEGTNDRRIGKLLGGIVQNEKLPKAFRETAYNGLFRLRGMAALDSPMPGKFRFPEEVDWQFVESFFRLEKDPGKTAI